jgi:hypothetical protein
LNKLNLKQAKANTSSGSMVRDVDGKQQNYKSSIVGGPRGGRQQFEDGQDGIFRINP